MNPVQGLEVWTLAGHVLPLGCMQDGAGVRYELAQALAASFLGQNLPWVLERTALGCPALRLMDRESPAAHISFTRRPGLLWAAVCSVPVGLDAAGAEEFGPDYPRERVFGTQELELARSLSPDQAESMALLWALKEASAKACGTGFNRVEPCDIIASDLRSCGSGLQGVELTPAGPLPVRADRRDGYWLAVALRVGGPGNKDV